MDYGEVVPLTEKTLRKGLVFAVICLFVGAGIVPIIKDHIQTTDELKSEERIQIAEQYPVFKDVPMVSNEVLDEEVNNSNETYSNRIYNYYEFYKDQINISNSYDDLTDFYLNTYYYHPITNEKIEEEYNPYNEIIKIFEGS